MKRNVMGWGVLLAVLLMQSVPSIPGSMDAKAHPTPGRAGAEAPLPTGVEGTQGVSAPNPAHAEAPPASPKAPGQHAERIGKALSQLPGWMPPAARVQALAQEVGEGAYALVTDTDDDGLPDLLLAHPDRVPPGRVVPEPVATFRGADLAEGAVRPHPLGTREIGWFRNVEQVGDVNGDGRTEVVLTYDTHGSGGIVLWQIFQWNGRAYVPIFDGQVSRWRGPNWLWLEPGRIGLTCRPMGTYDHKTAPHRQDREVWSWRDGRYRLTSHHRPPATTARQQVNDAEPYFRGQRYAEALPLYQRALSLPATEMGRDWHPYVLLRLGQTYALLGREEEARDHLSRAVVDGSFVGRAAALLLKEYQDPARLPGALAALMAMGAEPADGRTVRLTGADLAPPEVVLQAFLSKRSPEALAAGGPAALPGLLEVRQADLNGDGTSEIWARFAPAGPEPDPIDVLAVRTPQGWRATPTETGWLRPPTIGPDPTQGGRLHSPSTGPAPTQRGGLQPPSTAPGQPARALHFAGPRGERFTLTVQGAHLVRTAQREGELVRTRRPLWPSPEPRCHRPAE